METLLIPCPKCGKELRLKDRSKLGKRGRCPKCSHVFLLEEPEEVELELAEETAEPAVGTAAQWVPDSPSTSAQPSQPSSPTDSPDNEAPISQFAAPEDDLQGVARLREIRRKNAKRRNIAIAIGVVTALGLAGVFFTIQSYRTEEAAQKVNPPPEVDEQRIAEREQLKENTQQAQLVSPTQGEPIDLAMLPAGARIILNIHPAQIWSEGSLGQEFLFCLGPLGEWLGNSIEQVCQYPPQEIEQALIAVLLGPRGTQPQIATVVHFAEEKKKSELLLKFGGERVDEYGHPVYLSEDRAYLIKDLKTLAIAPRDRAGEMVDALKYPNPTSPGIEQLILQTDRERLVTLLFVPQDVRIHQENLASQDIRPFLNQTLDWFGDDVETVAWSLHLGQKFHSELLMRSRNLITPARLEKEMEKKLHTLPKQILNAVRKMTPSKLGHRKIIGRFPAMMKVVEMATVGGIGNRHIQFVTLLPERAGPNLALGSLLTWDESTRTDFNRSVEPAQPKKPQIPEKIADRLKMKIEIDFRRTPLQGAFQYIGEETHVPFDIDGEALKLAGYTKNMPQSFKLGKVPATQALKEILKKYEEMCIVVDEKNKKATVMTFPVAEKKELEPFPIREK